MELISFVEYADSNNGSRVCESSRQRTENKKTNAGRFFHVFPPDICCLNAFNSVVHCENIIIWRINCAVQNTHMDNCSYTLY